MTKEELKTLGEKIARGEASKQEAIDFMKELNSAVNDIKTNIEEISSTK